MKRDMDFIRDLLLKIENGQKRFETISSEEASSLGFQPDEEISQQDADRLVVHLDLLEDAQFIEIEARMGGGTIWIRRLTWKGSDFLDAVRDPETWAKTKKAAIGAGGFTLDLLQELAKGFIKKQIEDRTGIKL